MESLCRLSESLVNADRRVLGIVLFGSLARGDYGRRSDADLLVWLRSPCRERPVDRIPTYLRAFLDAPVPVDVFPFTAEELGQRLDQGSPFWRRVRDEVLLLAGRTPPMFAETIGG